MPTPGTPSASFPEALLILCVARPVGRLHRPTYLDRALAGGVLADLVLAGAATVDGVRLHLRVPGPAGAVSGIPPVLLARVPSGEPPPTFCINRPPWHALLPAASAAKSSSS